MKRIGITLAMIAAALLGGAALSTPSAHADVPTGLAWLESHQNADGSWGTRGSLLGRDTAATLEALRRNGRMGGDAFVLGRAWLAAEPRPNVDLRARVAAVEGLAGGDAGLAALWALRRPASSDAADANYPEGGWGVGPDYQTDVLDTALALQAFAAAGFDQAQLAKNESLAKSAEKTYTVRTPIDATSLTVYFPALTFAGGSGKLNVWFVGPSGRFPTSGYYQIPGPGYAITWDGADSPPFASGLNEVHVQNDGTSTGTATYTIEISFVAGGSTVATWRIPSTTCARRGPSAAAGASSAALRSTCSSASTG